MKLPQECGDLAGKTVKLNKAIYGLKTSCRDYVEAFNSRVLNFEYEGNKFERLFSDSCIYRMTCPDGKEVILCAYVDDLICAVNSPEAGRIRKALLDHIREQWAVRVQLLRQLRGRLLQHGTGLPRRRCGGHRQRG